MKYVQGDSSWMGVVPEDAPFRLACCDCGLVHEMEFRAIEIEQAYANGVKIGRILPPGTFQVEFRARRAARLTATQRKRRH